MFSYYGSKSKLAHLYPAPTYDTIVEPFAGSAAYSLYGNNWRKNVILYDSNPKISAIWRYLIDATEEDIEALPDLAPGEKVTSYPGLADAERWLIGFFINRGSSMPKVTASRRSDGLTYKGYLRENLHKIKHWKVFGAGYASCPDLEATWFIDPPYQKAGKYYFGHSKMDYADLSEWTRNRQGQVIVCENEGADWLPFRPLVAFRGSTKTQVEVIYLQEKGLPLSF
ncbi:MAG: DNA adenine methylase [Terriglobia bacterium]